MHTCCFTGPQRCLFQPLAEVTLLCPGHAGQVRIELHAFSQKSGNFLDFFFFLCTLFNTVCFICRLSDSTVSVDAGIEPRTVATSALTARHPNLSARSHQQSPLKVPVYPPTLRPELRIQTLKVPSLFLLCCFRPGSVFQTKDPDPGV